MAWGEPMACTASGTHMPCGDVVPCEAAIAYGDPVACMASGYHIHLLLEVVQVHVVGAQGARDLLEVGTQGGGGLTKGVRLRFPSGVVTIIRTLPEARSVGYGGETGFEDVLGE